MDALEFYIAELDHALNQDGRASAIEDAARNVLTAWDAENTPDDDDSEVTDPDEIARIVNETQV